MKKGKKINQVPEGVLKLQKNNISLANGSKTGTIKNVGESMKLYDDDMESFAADLYATRMGKKIDPHTERVLPAQDLSFAQAIERRYKIIPPTSLAGKQLSRKDQEMFVINRYMLQNGVLMSHDTLQTLAQRFGASSMLEKKDIINLMNGHSSYGAVNNTGDIPNDFRFIIPEVILAAIRIDYEASALNQNWIGNTVNITKRKVTLPQIRRGNAGAKIIKEGESIPFGTVKFGQKEVTVFKVGIGFQITDELVADSTIDMVFQFLGEVGNDMSIMDDVEAHRVLVNGDQDDNSESAPVIGVETPTAFAYRDLRKSISRMVRLKRNVSRIISSENDGVDLSLLPEFIGFAGDRRLGDFQTILGVPTTLVNDVWAQTAGQIILLDPNSAMMKLNYGSMTTETRRDPQNQTSEIFVTKHVGFAIKRRDGRLVVDKDLDFNAGNGFPEYMDIDARISEAYKRKLD